ncbi:hypothetical protein CRU98_09615 [Arcobacter sp. CECT 8986]|uniref:immunoglobulin-like domain-containing protein n=1 Tax=Arcobacter sp. CECT 8986 TaxID=2044507 RepID=UPI001009AC6D|nr:immunoglobulin-like domain-containing protein [Arcobacter sp. CECT 8986]RXJ98618.1 hypothetical protein CRU98_09615 [Arcobacter sp. CECT 8986]
MLNLIVKEPNGTYDVVAVKEDMVITPKAGQQFYFDNYSGSNYTFNLVDGDKSIELIINLDPPVKIVFNDMVDLITDQNGPKTVLSMIDNPTGIYDLQNTVMNSNFKGDDVISSLKDMLSKSELASNDGIVIDDFGSLSSALDAAAAGGPQGDTSTFNPINFDQTAAANVLAGRSQLNVDVNGNPTPVNINTNNNPDTEVTITLTSTTQITEDDNSITYTATLSTPALSDMSIILSNGSIINIPAGASTGTVISPVTPDSDVYSEADQTVTTTISGTVGGGFDTVNSTTSTTTTIVDSIDTTKVTLTADETVEAGKDITYTASVKDAPQTDLVIKLSNGSEITIEAGKTSGSVKVASADDVYGTTDGTTETVSITGTTGGNYEKLDTSDTATTTVTETTPDEVKVSLSATNTNEAAGTVTFTATLEKPVLEGDDPVVVHTTLGDITITSGTTGTLEVTNENTEDVYKDASTLDNKITSVSGGNFENLTADTDTVTAKVADTIDTTKVTLTADETVEAGKDITYTASVKDAPQTDLVIKLSNGSEITIEAGKTSGSVKVASADDVYGTTDGTTETVSITGTTGGNYEKLDTSDTATTTVTETTPDEVKVSLSAIERAIEDGGSITYTAKIVDANGKEVTTNNDVTVKLNVGANGEAVSETNPALTITIKAGSSSGTVDATVSRDDVYKEVDSDGKPTDSLSASIASVSEENAGENGSFEKLTFDSTAAKTIIYDDVDPVDVSISAVATAPKIIDVNTEFGEGTGISISTYDTNGNEGNLSVVKGTNHDGFGVYGNTSGSGANSELGHGWNGVSEKIVFDFTNDVDSIDVAFAWRNNHETAKITFSDDGKEIGYATVSGGGTNTDAVVRYYDMNNHLLKEVGAQGGTDRVDLSYTFEFPDADGNPMAFDKAEFSAPGHDDDYLIHEISYTEVINPEIANISTTDGQITFNIQIDENYPPQGKATAVVEVNGKDYNVDLNATGRGTLTLDAKDFSDLSDIDVKVKEVIGGNYEEVNTARYSFDLSGSFTDDLTSTNDSITIDEDQTYALTENDFGELGKDVTQIKITEIPSEGTLYLTVTQGQTVIDANGQEHVVTTDTKVEVNPGQVISLANVAAGNLSYEPKDDSDTDVKLKFQIGDEDGNFKSTEYTTDINITAVADLPTASIDVSGGVEKTVTVESKGGNNGFGNGDQNAPGNSEFNNNAENAGGNQENITFDLVKIGETTFSIADALQNVNTNGTDGDDTITYHDIAGGSNINSNGGNDIIAITGDINGGAVAGGSGVDLLYLAKDASKYELMNYNGPEQGHDNIDVRIKDLDTNQVLTVNNIEGIVFGDGTTKGGAEIPTPETSTKTVVEYDVDFNAALHDIDGSESLTVTITNVPEGAEFTSTSSAYTLTNNNDGTWSVELPDGTKNVTDSIKMTVPEGTENIDLGITARATEARDNDDGTNFKEANDSDALVYSEDETKTLDYDANTVKSDENVVIVLDLSGSMTNNSGKVTLADGSVTTRLAIAKDALEDLINTYDDLSNVNINLTTFGTDAKSYSGWMNAEDAINTINSLHSGDEGVYTNYEDALFETYDNYQTPENGEKSTVYFISDGAPNVENNDTTGTGGTDTIWRSGTAIDEGYITKWGEFLGDNVKELNVVGIGKGITNTTYLDMVAESVGNVKTNVMVIEDENELKDKLIENIFEKVEGNVLDNITGGDDDITITSIEVDGVSHTISEASNNILTLQTSSGGTLEFNFETGDYSFGGLRNSIVENSESFTINASDSNGDTTNFDVKINIVNEVDTEAKAPKLSFSIEENGEVEISGSSSLDLTFDEWDGSTVSSNSTVLNNLGYNDNYFGNSSDNKVLINNSIDGDIYSGGGNDEVVISGNVQYNSDIKTSSGDDSVTVKGNINGDINTAADYYQGSDDDKVQIEGDVTYNTDIVTGRGADEVYVGGSIDGDIDTGTGNDKVHIKGDASWNSEISLGSGDDILQIDGRVHDYNISGGEGNDAIILNGYTKEEYDNNVDNIQYKIKDFENIKVGDSVVKGESSIFNSVSSSSTTAYSYTITLAAALVDLDGSETLSKVTLDNIPDTVTLIKDSSGVEYNVTGGVVELPVEDAKEEEFTFVSSERLDSTEINSMTASVTSTESENDDTNTVTTNAKLEVDVDATNHMSGTDADEKFDSHGSNATIDAGKGDDEIVFHAGDIVDGGEGEDTLLIIDDDESIDLSGINTINASTDLSQVHNIEAIDLSNDIKDNLVIDEEAIENLTDNENVLKIFGDDSGDRVTLEGGSDNWKSGGQFTDDDGTTFNVFEGTTSGTSNIKVLIDEDVSIDPDI